MPNNLRNIERVFEELAIPTLTAAIVDPKLAVITAFLFGSLKIVRKWQLERIQEAHNYVGTDKLLDLLQRDDKSRDILHKVLTNILDEQSLKKRQLFYEYLKNLHKGIRNEFDYHTKIIFTINLITFEELDLLINLLNKYNEILLVASKQEDAGNPEEFTEKKGISISDIIKSEFIKLERIDIETSLENISSYGLIHTRPGRYNGTYYLPLTKFGEAFMEFINLKT